MMYHFFLHYGWILRNLRKEAVRTNMHTTAWKKSAVHGKLTYTISTNVVPTYQFLATLHVSGDNLVLFEY